MLKITSLVILGTFAALATADLTTFLSKQGSHTWSSLVYSEGLIPQEFDSTVPQLTSGSGSATSELEKLLSNKNVLQLVYANYKNTYGDKMKAVDQLFSKLYENGRAEILKEKLITIAKHNLEALAGLHTWTKGVNTYSHLTTEEFTAMFSSGATVPSSNAPTISLGEGIPNGTAPTSKNWKDDGYVTSVKNQGGCGSCYAFAGIAGLESGVMIRFGKQYAFDLSEQEIIDCNKAQGCSGGNVGDVYPYEEKNGIAQEYQYAYNAKDKTNGNTCKASSADNRLHVAPVANNYITPQSDENAVAEAVGTYGPATVILNSDGWGDYKSGVFTSGCGPKLDGKSNHVVLIVGYTPDTWTIKNSWGPDWGEQGYIRISRGSNLCGVADWANVITKIA